MSIRFPSNQTSPPSGRSNPTMCLSSTLLPVPLAPMTTRLCPFSIFKSRPFSTTRLPNRLETCLSSMKDIVSSEQTSHTINRQIPVLRQLCRHEIQHDDRDEAGD